MASDGQGSTSAQNQRVGQNWSGGNPIPTVQKFMQNLDQDKQERDQRIDEENRAKQQHANKYGTGARQDGGKSGDAVAHQAREVSEANVRTVTDPTTGRDIGVEDQNEKSMDAIRDPKVRGRSCLYTGRFG